MRLVYCHGDCGTQVESRTTPRVYCPSCRINRKRASSRIAMERQRRKRGVLAVKGSIKPCEDCGAAMILNRNAKARCCPACRAQRVLERSRSVARSRKGVPGAWDYNNAWARSRRKSDPSWGVSAHMRVMLHRALGRKKAGKSWREFVPYSLEDLMVHLESKFLPGMTWDNRAEWHIDHIRPLCSFSFTTPDCPQFREAWALSNLQPLWAVDNLKKGGRWAA